MALGRRVRTSELFPGFTDVSKISSGRLSVVYRAREVGTDRRVALKVLNRAETPPLAVESYQRESVALGALSTHPNVVTLYRTFKTAAGRPKDLAVLPLLIATLDEQEKATREAGG